MRETPHALPILAWARAGEDVDELHSARFGRAFRRISRYVKLAQVGAMACIDQVDRATLDPRRVGVFLGSGLGNTADIVPLAEGILHPARPWASPMAFAGCVGNAAAFHVARTLELDGPNVTVSQEELSFEAALLEATLALHTGIIDHALVGGVDVRTGEDDVQRARCNAADVPGTISEGTGWILIGRSSLVGRGGEPPPQGPLSSPRNAPPAPAILGVTLGAGPVRGALAGLTGTILPGWRIDPAELDTPAKIGPREPRIIPVATAMRLVELLDGTTLLSPGHPDEPGRGAVTLVQRTSGGLVGTVRVELP